MKISCYNCLFSLPQLKEPGLPGVIGHHVAKSVVKDTRPEIENVLNQHMYVMVMLTVQEGLLKNEHVIHTIAQVGV